MKNKIKILLILLIILSGIDIYLKFNTKEKYYVDSDNIIHHENRPKIEFTRQLVEDRENYTKEKIMFFLFIQEAGFIIYLIICLFKKEMLL